MKMKIWIEEAMKVLLVVGRLFSDGTFGVGKKRHCFR